MKHDGGNTWQYQENHAGLRTLPRNPGECEIFLVGVGALFLLLVIWKVPQWQAASWQDEQDRIERKELAKLENDARMTIVQAFGGLALLVGLLFTWRNARATERASQETLKVSQEGQITERFTKAINQLGEAGPEKLAIRLGGIYALERIARDSERDHWPIMEVLTAYLREHTRRKEGDQLSKETRSPNEPQPIQNTQPPPRLATDIQAILTILGRRMRAQDKDGLLDLAGTNLCGADLSGGHFEHANLMEADLVGVDLSTARHEKLPKLA